jgi:hypothetical protein
MSQSITLRQFVTCLASVLMVTGMLGIADGPAAATEPTPSAIVIQSCYGSAKAINGTDPNWHWPPGGSAYTTSNCVDINVKMNRTMQVRTCFEPTSGGIQCNAYRTVYANTWGLAATNVKDGTRFHLIFDTEAAFGLAAY